MKKIHRVITPVEAERQKATATERLGVGVWKDSKGYIHFALPELLDHYELEHTPENIAFVQDAINSFIAELNPDAIIVRQDIGPVS